VSVGAGGGVTIGVGFSKTERAHFLAGQTFRGKKGQEAGRAAKCDEETIGRGEESSDST